MGYQNDKDKYYAILGLPPGSSEEAIKAAYKKKASELHPDRNKKPDAVERFQELSEAYTLLTNNLNPTYSFKRPAQEEEAESDLDDLEHSKFKEEKLLKNITSMEGYLYHKKVGNSYEITFAGGIQVTYTSKAIYMNVFDPTMLNDSLFAGARVAKAAGWQATTVDNFPDHLKEQAWLAASKAGLQVAGTYQPSAAAVAALNQWQQNPAAGANPAADPAASAPTVSNWPPNPFKVTLTRDKR